MPSIKGLPGGAQKSSVGTTAVVIDLTALATQRVKIWSDEDDLLFSFSATNSASGLVVSGDQLASTSELVADRAALGLGVLRVVSKRYPFLVVRTASLASGATVRVKPVGQRDSSEG